MQKSSERWLRERSHEAYARNYDLVFPNDEHLGGRNLQLAPLNDQLVKAGAIMQARAGWERPAYFIQKDKVIIFYIFTKIFILLKYCYIY